MTTNFSHLLQPLTTQPDMFNFHDQLFKKMSKKPKRESAIVSRLKPFSLNLAAQFELRLDTTQLREVLDQFSTLCQS